MSSTLITWNGAAAITVLNDKLLMVRGKGTTSWGVPSGQIEIGETAEQACIREVSEETGYTVMIKEALHTKKTVIGNYDVTTYYFLCEVVSGQITYHDPDEIIEEIAWKTYDELASLQHDYPEDKEVLLSFVNVR
ncbi:NUDIX hydrolase [Solibacillus sp. CAU 1738]|uniref:NUDIX hydrolase n=1 Tax=Solibacillus sp. CAU 1738 TaxID=3140363 RepID=UPI00326055FE